MPRNNFKKWNDYNKAKIAEAAVRNDLVTLPPPKQRQEIDFVKSHVDELHCVEVQITFTQQLIKRPDKVLRKLCKGLFEKCMENKGTAIFYHEYSDIGRFHYHGILSKVSPQRLSTIRKEFEHYIGRIEIKTISFFESYLIYMTKQVADPEHEDSLDFSIHPDSDLEFP